MDEQVESKLEEFFGRYRLRKYSKGQILILNGDKSQYVYQLVSGRVKQYDITPRGDEVILNTFKPPAFFPMSLAISRDTSPYIFEAETSIEVRQAPAAETVEFVKQNPAVMFDLLSRLYRGLDGLIGRMAHIMGSNAKGRLMYEVLLACRRFGEQQKDNSHSVALNETELAARAGLSRETVSREMHKLRDEGLLEVGSGRIKIHSLSALEEKLGNAL